MPAERDIVGRDLGVSSSDPAATLDLAEEPFQLARDIDRISADSGRHGADRRASDMSTEASKARKQRICGIADHVVRRFWLFRWPWSWNAHPGWELLVGRHTIVRMEPASGQA
jgi:hypothetical protein